MLHRLAGRFALVAVVSGRAAGQLLDWLGPEVEIWGAHGAQRVVDGRVVLAEETAPYADTMAEVLDRAGQEIEHSGIEGIRIEDKTVIVGLHYRPATDPERAKRVVEEVTASLADEFGLEWSSSRMAVELKPPVEISKARVVGSRTRELSLPAALYTGDDVVDLSAFDALDELAREGVVTVRIAVDSDEAPDELLRRADIVVQGPKGVLDLFAGLA